MNRKLKRIYLWIKLSLKGGYPLKGTVNISGAKNAALPAIAACLLTGGTPSSLKGIPRLRDIRTIKSIMEKLGTVFQETGDVLEVNSGQPHRSRSPI